MEFWFQILDLGFWGFGFGFVSMIPPTTKETRFLDLFVCTLVGRPWCWPHMSCGCDGPGADQRHIGRQSNLGNQYLGPGFRPPQNFLFADFMLKPWIHKTRQKKQMIKQQKKTTKEAGEKSTLPAKSFFLTFFWAYWSRRNSREYFSAHFWSLLQIFKKQTIMNRTLQLFWWCPFYHFDILLAVLMNLDVVFFFFGSWN